MEGTRERRPVVVLLLVLLSSGGCSASDSIPGPTTRTVTVSSPSTSSTQSATAQPTPPVLPAAARQPTRAGAEAFFRYFWDVYNYSFDVRDPALLMSVSDPLCTFCKSSVDDVNKALRRELRFQGGVVSVKVGVAAPDDPTAGVLVNAVIDQAESTIVDSRGEPVSSAPAENGTRVDAAVIYERGRWIMLGLEKKPKP